MEAHPPPWTLSELVDILGAELHGPPDAIVLRPVPAGDGDPQGITFAEGPEYVARAESSTVGAVIVGRDVKACARPHLKVDSPRAAFVKLLALWVRPLPLREGVHPTAIIDPEARIHDTVSIGPCVVVEKGASIGARARLYPFCYVGQDCVVEDECVLHPHVVLYQDVWLGARTVVHSGTVIGADGFGYFWDGNRRVKIPQVGGVRIGEDVEIGVNTAIDRATAGYTRIGSGSKIDNLVQIAHNVSIGDDVAIASLSGIAGSAEIGDRVVMAGDVGVGDHTKIVDDVILGGRSVATSDILEPGEYLGFPAKPITEARRALILATKLPEFITRIRELERRLTELEAKAKE